MSADKWGSDAFPMDAQSSVRSRHDSKDVALDRNLISVEEAASAAAGGGGLADIISLVTLPL